MVARLNGSGLPGVLCSLDPVGGQVYVSDCFVPRLALAVSSADKAEVLQSVVELPLEHGYPLL